MLVIFVLLHPLSPVALLLLTGKSQVEYVTIFTTEYILHNCNENLLQVPQYRTAGT